MRPPLGLRSTFPPIKTPPPLGKSWLRACRPIDLLVYIGLHCQHVMFSRLYCVPHFLPPSYSYNMMMNCWKSDPGTRPSFPSLEEDLRAILDGGTSHNTPPADSATPPARQDDGSRSGIPDPWHPDPSSADSRPASGMEDKATDDKYREFLKEI